ncbi:MAG: ATP-binding protein, partial [Phycisphaerales bacterium]|nr:ATP-binding protein [Phycisphaerales bacterium]
DLPLVFCDAEKVGRVIINLAINALKFCGESGTVELRARHAPGSAEVMVSVVDSGAGIAQDDVHRIFERFRQASASPQSGIKGFGLGLSIVKELVQLNLGSIDVDSTLGQGSTFSFTLPVADPHSVIRRYLDRVESLRGAVDRVAICTVEHVSGRPADAARVIGRLAHRCDLLFPVESGRSLLVVAGCGDSESDLVARLTQTAKDASASLSDEGVDIRIQSVGAWTFPENADEICVAFESLTKQRGETACLASVTS